MVPLKRPLDESDAAEPVSKISRLHQSESASSHKCRIDVRVYSRLKAEKYDPKPDRCEKSALGLSGQGTSPTDPSRDTAAAAAAAAAVVPDERILSFKQLGWHRCFVDPSQNSWFECWEDPIGSEAELFSYSLPENFADIMPYAVWFEAVDAIAMPPHSDARSSELARLESYLIRRSRMSRRFLLELWSDMAEVEIELTIFDLYGRLKPCYQHHPVKKGSGVWGDEMNRNDLLIIKLLEVDDAHLKNTGLENDLVSALLGKVRQKTTSCFALVNSKNTPQSATTAQELDRTARKNAEFWESFGFRRIGNTSIFAWASDPTHPSHSLEPTCTDDCDPSQPRPTVRPDMQLVFNSFLKHTDGKCVRTVSHALGSPERDPRWTARDEQGYTLLHQAALFCKPRCIRWLLAQCPELAEMRNSDGDTPLECLLSKLVAYREESTLLSPGEEFTGHDDNSVECWSILKGHLAGNQRPSEDAMLRAKYGCTCDQCIDGFVSPRMLQTLFHHATRLHRRLDEYLELVKDVDSKSVANLTFPPHIQTDFHPDKAILKGFSAIVSVIAKALGNNDVPHIDDLPGMCESADAPTREAARHAIKKGNGHMIKGALVHIFEQAMVDDEWVGYPPYDRPRDELAAKIAELPCCHNDTQYVLAARFCGFTYDFLPFMAMLRRTDRVEEQESWHSLYCEAIDAEPGQ